MTNTRVAPRSQSGVDVTIDRFGQEEDVTGGVTGFVEPIGRVADRAAVERSSPRHHGQAWRTHSKQSPLGDPLTKFHRQRSIADQRSHKFGV